MRKPYTPFILVFLLFSFCIPGAAYSDDLPLVPLAGEEKAFLPGVITWEQLNHITGGNEDGLSLDLLDESLSGQIYMSAYPFEAGDSGYDYLYFMDKAGSLAQGAGVLPLAKTYTAKYDANSWFEGGASTATPTVAYRLRLFQTGKKYLGLYSSFVSFDTTEDGAFRKLPTIIDGPYVTLVCSDDPTSIEIVWETDEPCSGKVILGGATYNGADQDAVQHAVKISGLNPNSEYDYYVESGASDGRTVKSNTYTVRTAPEKGQGDVIFAYASDSRSGLVGGGERDYMGCNLYILKQIAANAFRQGSDFFIFGGDEVYGLTTEPKEFHLQLKGWKQGMAGFWRTRPVYAGMGNHEIVLKYIDDGENSAYFDAWPYETDSGEAIFEAEMFNPLNGPEVSDARRPTYRENVYSFQYGPVMVISFNNTYWMTLFDKAPEFGGAPGGYIMEDQLKWIEETIAAAESDSSVKFVFLFGHAPVFPCMGHVDSAMWWGGDNNMRAYTKNSESGELEPEGLGIVEVRNRFWKACAQSSKVAAVFTGDEHAYHRTLITDQTPVGIYPGDDTDGDGKLDKYSPNPEFTRPVWHITCGGGGAPYVANVESTPWTPERVTSNFGYLLLKTQGDKVSMEFVGNPTGQVLDKVDDLMAVK